MDLLTASMREVGHLTGHDHQGTGVTTEIVHARTWLGSGAQIGEPIAGFAGDALQR